MTTTMTEPSSTPSSAPISEPVSTPTSAPSNTPGTDVPEVVFSAPVPGLRTLTRFALVHLDEVGGLFSLRSLEDPAVRLVVAMPWLCAPGYTVDLDDDVCAEIGLQRPEDALVLLVVHPGATLADSTVNLLAPVVIDSTTGRAAQVVQADSSLPLRAPLLSA